MKKFSTPPLRRPPKETMNKEKATNEFQRSYFIVAALQKKKKKKHKKK